MRMGSCASSKMDSRTRFVSETSAVGMSQKLFIVLNKSSANFGKFPVP